MNDIELLALNSSDKSSKSLSKKEDRAASTKNSSKVHNGKGDADITNSYALSQHEEPNFDHSASLPSPLKNQQITSPRKSDTSDTKAPSQLSDDIYFTSRKASIESLSKTDSKSYKEKIKNRFKTIKENASNQSNVSFKKSSEKIIERIRKENREINDRFQIKSKKCKSGMVDRQEMQTFFTSEENPIQVTRELNEDTKEKNDSQRSINDSIEELINDESFPNDDIEYRYPELLKVQEKLSNKEWLFHPDGCPIEPSKKTSNAEIRNLEEEGFFLPDNPKYCRRHINMIEKRLLGIDDRKWFNSQGDLNILENPISNSSVRPQGHQDTANEITYFCKPTVDAVECQEVLVINENILQVNLRNLRFEHHALFSLEHVLERQLIKHCRIYETYINNNTLKKISHRLEAARQILINLEKTTVESNGKKLITYKKEVKDLRESLFIHGQQERKSLKSILSLWKSIKKLRSKNGYHATSIKLIIKKKTANDEYEERTYEENLQRCYHEILGEYREEFKSKMKAYKDQINEFKASPRSESDATLESPKKPKYTIDEELVFQQLKSRFEECFKNPGEPDIQFSIENIDQVPNDIQNPREILRRRSVSTTKIQLKVICNKLTVCKTKPLNLGDDFICNFNESLSILLTNVPKFITALLLEQSNNSEKRIIAEINLEVPSQVIKKIDLRQQTFEKIATIQYKHEGVGSGIRLLNELEKKEIRQQFKMDDIELNTAGVLSYNMCWKNQGSDVISEDVGYDRVIESVIDKNCVIHVDKLREWINQHKPDPQNPKNAILYEYIQGFDEDISLLNQTKYFRLNPYQKNFNFCDINEIDDNLRMKLLQLRNQNEPEFDGMVIPSRVKEISGNIFKEYKRRVAFDKERFPLDEDEKDYDTKRKYGIDNLKQIYTKIFQKCKSSENNLEYEDVVDEKFLLHFERILSNAFTNILSWFSWGSQIENKNKFSTKKVIKANLEDQKFLKTSSSVKIEIKILNGINIPQRDFSASSLISEKFTNEFKMVNSFVEAKYNDLYYRTSAVKGTNPEWSEELTLVLNPTHFDYLNPSSFNGNILLNVFDQLDDNISVTDIEAKNWLGFMEIPLSAISSNHTMKGFFKLNTPYVFFGYIKEDPVANSKSFSQASTQSYLHLEINVHPKIPKLIPSIDELPSSDLPYITDHILKWNETFNANFSSRRFSAMSINTSGKTTCLIRYINPLEPPQLNNEGFDVDPEQCAKFVSLIPFTDNNQFYQNVWLSTDELLRFVTGSIIDHAIALTCFLLALKIEVWLLLGYGIPYGSTAFVLVRESTTENENFSYFIYDVVNGEKINLTNIYCPLQKIFCLVGERNIWANIQRNDNVSLTRFDLNRRSDWIPLFTMDFKAPTNSINKPVAYEVKKNAGELEIKLEKKIKKIIENSRPLNRTIWNKKVSTIIKNNIHLLEYVFINGRSNEDIYKEITKNLIEYNVTGYIVHFPYTSFSSVIRKIKTFGVHLQHTSVNEFSIAVQFQEKPSFIASVWIFLASVTEKNIV